MCDQTQVTITKYYEYMSAQIDREDELIHKRITWFLTFEGFLFASLSLSKNQNLFNDIKYVIPLLGATVAVLALFGIGAALRAIKELKEGWRVKTAHLVDNPYPRAYGSEVSHFLGSSYSLCLPIAVMSAWIYIFYSIATSP